MGDLTGTWHIYSRKIGSDAVFKAPDSRVTFDGDNKTDGFDLSTKEEAAFTASGNQYYLGESTHYLYRAQVLESSGLKLLAGHVSTRDTNKKRCLFAGLLVQRGGTLNLSTLGLGQILHIPLAHTTTSRHMEGGLHVDRRASNKTVLLKRMGAADLSFDIIDYRQDTHGIHLKAKQASPPGDDELEARIIFGPGSRPIYIGYHWNPSDYSSVSKEPTTADGAPVDERCTRAIIGW